MAMGQWSKSYVIPSIALSLTAAGFLTWHVLDPSAKVDAWTITLLVVGFLPWLGTVFESIDFPGGGSVKWRQLEAAQERQQSEIAAMRFLVANFLTAGQKRVLRRFADDGPYEFVNEPSPRDTLNAVGPLVGAGLLEANPASTPETAPILTADEYGSGDIKIAYRITAVGLEYLKVLDKTGFDK